MISSSAPFRLKDVELLGIAVDSVIGILTFLVEKLGIFVFY